MSRSAAAFRYSARRRALAERHQRPEIPVVPGGRLHGLCSLCGEYHRQPDLRWKCSECGTEICAETRTAVCPECGTELGLNRVDLGKEEEP